MNILLDTQILLWTAGQTDRLTDKATKILERTENVLHFSAVSLWEVVIKNGLDRDDFRVDPSALRRNLVDNGFRELAISSPHVLGVSALPPLHKDPFDRLLIAQANVEGLTLFTSDALVARYNPAIMLM